MSTFEEARQVQILRENVYLLRKSQGLSNEQLSKRSGIPVEVLYALENGEDVDMKYCLDLCRYYGKTLEQLFVPLERDE